jgi:hypothetical protein
MNALEGAERSGWQLILGVWLMVLCSIWLEPDEEV